MIFTSPQAHNEASTQEVVEDSSDKASTPNVPPDAVPLADVIFRYRTQADLVKAGIIEPPPPPPPEPTPVSDQDIRYLALFNSDLARSIGLQTPDEHYNTQIDAEQKELVTSELHESSEPEPPRQDEKKRRSQRRTMLNRALGAAVLSTAQFQMQQQQQLATERRQLVWGAADLA